MTIELFSVPVVSNATQEPDEITPDGSPFIIQNTIIFDVDIVVSGGIVTLIEFSRNGTDWFACGLTAGLFRLSRLDRLRITYAVAPTLNRIFR